MLVARGFSLFTGWINGTGLVCRGMRISGESQRGVEFSSRVLGWVWSVPVVGVCYFVGVHTCEEFPNFLICGLCIDFSY